MAFALFWLPKWNKKQFGGFCGDKFPSAAPGKDSPACFKHIHRQRELSSHPAPPPVRCYSQKILLPPPPPHPPFLATTGTIVSPSSPPDTSDALLLPCLLSLCPLQLHMPSTIAPSPHHISVADTGCLPTSHPAVPPRQIQ